MRYALEISFDGTAYNGWQRQLNAPSVQEMIETKLAVVTGESCVVTGCGRTDTGVHAAQFFLHMDILNSLPSNFIFRMNSILPEDIAVKRIYRVSDEFNARFDARSRTYHYRTHLVKDPFLRKYAYRYPYAINLDLLNSGADVTKQYNEFGSFCKSKSQNKTNICEIMDARWEVRNNEVIFVIKADRFLRNMVRAIVGTMFELNEGKIDLDDLHRIIQSGDRTKAGRSAPAHGLTLVEINYDRDNWIALHDE